MSGSLNRVTLIGNLGNDPEVRHTQTGQRIVTLSIATSERWKDQRSGEARERLHTLPPARFCGRKSRTHESTVYSP
jgi:single stranded DNA-binding protein